MEQQRIQARQITPGMVVEVPPPHMYPRFTGQVQVKRVDLVPEATGSPAYRVVGVKVADGSPFEYVCSDFMEWLLFGGDAS